MSTNAPSHYWSPDSLRLKSLVLSKELFFEFETDHVNSHHLCFAKITVRRVLGVHHILSFFSLKEIMTHYTG